MLTGSYCLAPAGKSVLSQSYLNNKIKNSLSHFLGKVVQAPSQPETTLFGSFPVPSGLCQP